MYALLNKKLTIGGITAKLMICTTEINFQLELKTGQYKDSICFTAALCDFPSSLAIVYRVNAWYNGVYNSLSIKIFLKIGNEDRSLTTRSKIS